MGLLDKLKEKAADLAEEAKDKFSDVTGLDADKVIESAKDLAEAGISAADGVTAARESTKDEPVG